MLLNYDNVWNVISVYIPNMLVHIFTFTAYLDTSINKLRCPDNVNILHNVNIFNSFHIISYNSFKYLCIIYIVSS